MMNAQGAGDKTLLFEVDRTDRQLRLRMSACVENIDEADAQISAFLESADSTVDLFAARILLREAALNAVTHGSGQDPGKEVRITATLEPDGFTLAVEDDGGGFVWQDREIKFDVTGDGGRGLALMQMYSTEMVFNEQGNRVELRRGYESRPSETGA